MTDFSTSPAPQPPAAGGAGRGVWIAVFVMGAIIIALLAAVLYKLMQPAAAPEAITPPVAALASQPAAALPAASAPAATGAVAALTGAQPAAQTADKTPAPRPETVEHPAAVVANTAPPPPRPATRPATSGTNVQAAAAPAANPAAAQQFAPQQFAPQPVPTQPQQFAPQATPQPAPAAPTCSNCGTVTAVTAQQVASDKANPLGVIAGGVIGGLLGNQVGNGNGRTAATVVGAIGGGLAGNEIAKRVDTHTVYDVQVRMDDGQMRTFRLQNAPPVGQRVQIGADGGLNPM